MTSSQICDGNLPSRILQDINLNLRSLIFLKDVKSVVLKIGHLYILLLVSGSWNWLTFRFSAHNCVRYSSCMALLPLFLSVFWLHVISAVFLEKYGSRNLLWVSMPVWYFSALPNFNPKIEISLMFKSARC